MIDLSVVIPVRNEEPSVRELHGELSDVLRAFGREYEIIVVDDGSTDRTFQLLAELQAVDPRLRVIQLRRNFGQTAAFAAGVDHARGRYIVTMAGDLHTGPHAIPGLIAGIEAGAAVVWGGRKDGKDPFLSRRLPSMTANVVISTVTGVHLHDYGCSLKVFRSEIIKPMKLYGEMHRFLPAIASEQTSNITEMAVNHRARRHGHSNYGITRTMRVVLDLVTVKFLLSYSTRPLQIFGLVGGAMGLAGLAITGWLAAIRLLGVMGLARDQSIGNRPLLLFGILLVFTGVQLVTLGLLAELQARTYHESQNKPIYVIHEIRQSPS